MWGSKEVECPNSNKAPRLLIPLHQLCFCGFKPLPMPCDQQMLSCLNFVESHNQIDFMKAFILEAGNSTCIACPRFIQISWPQALLLALSQLHQLLTVA